MKPEEDYTRSEPLPLPAGLRNFVEACDWVFAKTYAYTWPHEYIVRDKVDPGMFEQLVEHIREHGYKGRFYSKTLTYFDEDGLVYWTMGAPIGETIIINRCNKEGTYEERLKNGTLPEHQSRTFPEG